MQENTIICDCNDVCKSKIIENIKAKNLKSINEVALAVNAGTGCGGCHSEIQDILDEINN